MRLRLVYAGMAAACATLLPPAAASPGSVPSLPFCQRLVVSPAFATDGTAFCGAIPFEQGQPSVKLYVTHDHARTWTTLSPTGVDASTGGVQEVLISPNFPSDHLLVIQMVGGNVYYSLDAGQTFSRVPTVFGGGRIALVPATLPTLPQSVPGVPVDHAVILGAVPSGTPGRGFSYLFDPVLPSLRFVSGTSVIDQGFFVSPDYAKNHVALAAGSASDGSGGAAHEFVTLYSCDTNFSCRTKVHAFAAPNAWLDQVAFAADYDRGGTMLVTVADSVNNHYRVFVSNDRGAHFRVVTTVQAAIDRLIRAGGLATVAVNTGPPGSHTLFAYLVGGNAQTNKPPTDQLYRSRDDGRTWHLIAHNRCMCPPNGPGTLSYGAIYRSRSGAVTPSGIIIPAANRMMMTSRWWPTNAPAKFTVLCSADLGRTWSTPCR